MFLIFACGPCFILVLKPSALKTIVLVYNKDMYKIMWFWVEGIEGPSGPWKLQVRANPNLGAPETPSLPAIFMGHFYFSLTLVFI